MKIIELIWRDPSGSIVNERLEQEKFNVRTEPGWLKLTNADGPVRFIPSDKVCLIQFAEVEDQPRILRPDNITSMPLKGVPS